MQQNNDLKKDIVAGIIGYLTMVYIVVVNGSILNEAGLSLEAGMIATILASFAGTMLMGFFGKLPLILIPGMGINALFAYSIIGNNGFSFNEGLAVVWMAGILFMLTAFTKMGVMLKEAIPESLKHGITIGLGFFLILIGVEKSGIITAGEQSVIAIGDFTSPSVIAGIITLFIAIYLFVKGVPANFLITMIIGTVIAMLFGVSTEGAASVHFEFSEMLFMPSFSAASEISFWVSVFSLALILIFENMGILSSQLDMLKKTEAYSKSYRITATSALLSGIFGTSPTVSGAENAAVIASGGRTGKAAITAGILFLATIFIIPWISMVPATAISPILIIVGFLMAQNIKYLPWEQFAECIPALLIIVMIPFTYSIGDGMAFGFIAYPIVKIALGKRKEISIPLLTVSILFFAEFVLKVIGVS
ncbi:NCS2 family permease [Oceanobacillus neutriphilus]|uniref:Permease n=1 Tax=Oceanobacillus neutriphilus TaxID=531815 RepID=A0ABQ2NT66_9BACI|nr:NCS2 family permease [Oceanobacillus neutriphilus]GGP10210.1 permease [Oceanobacillus neutriphilus]